MSMNASAEIFFGIVIHDPDEEPIVPWIDLENDEDSGDFDSYVINGYTNITRPTDIYPENGNESPEAIATKQKYSDYWNACREFLKEIPIEEDHVGHHKYSTRVLKLKGWGIGADYSPETIDPCALIVTDEHLKTFREALIGLDLTNLPEPSIHLVASYG